MSKYIFTFASGLVVGCTILASACVQLHESNQHLRERLEVTKWILQTKLSQDSQENQ